MAGVSLGWMVFVAMTPAGSRPYIDGSVHNSVWESDSPSRRPVVEDCHGVPGLSGGSKLFDCAGADR